MILMAADAVAVSGIGASWRGPSPSGSSRVAAPRVIGGHLGQHDRDAVGILDPHFDQAPRLPRWPSQVTGPGRGQAVVLGADVPDLQPDHHRGPGRAWRVPGYLQQSLAEEEHHGGIVGRPELAVDRQAQYITVK